MRPYIDDAWIGFEPNAGRCRLGDVKRDREFESLFLVGEARTNGFSPVPNAPTEPAERPPPECHSRRARGRSPTDSVRGRCGMPIRNVTLAGMF